MVQAGNPEYKNWPGVAAIHVNACFGPPTYRAPGLKLLKSLVVASIVFGVWGCGFAGYVSLRESAIEGPGIIRVDNAGPRPTAIQSGLGAFDRAKEPHASRGNCGRGPLIQKGEVKWQARKSNARPPIAASTPGASACMTPPSSAAADVVRAICGQRRLAYISLTEITIAVIQVESGGNPGAKSKKGARGLMQIMPRTWADLTDEPFSRADEPELNIEIGTMYLVWIEKTLAGWMGRPPSIEQILAAYNGGIGRLRNGGYAIERMPRESREYVLDVMGARNFGEDKKCQ